jgi:hypothetical protein
LIGLPMGKPRPPLPVKLFVGMLSPDPGLFAFCTNTISTEYGLVEFESDILPWNDSEYYRAEMGEGIKRKIVVFERTIDPGSLPSVKHFTNTLEQSLSIPDVPGPRRRINLDPGYVTEAKVVLATTKDYAHRLYIGENIYAEVTLRYDKRKRSFVSHEFTYPDYGTQAYRNLFNRTRESLRNALHGITEKVPKRETN